MATPLARLYELLGKRVRERRMGLELRQEQLAEQVGLKRTSITNLETGRQRIPLDQLYRIAEVLDVELRDLLPTRQEIETPENVSVEVGGRHFDAPPNAARLIQKILASQTGGQDGKQQVAEVGGAGRGGGAAAPQGQGTPSGRGSTRRR